MKIQVTFKDDSMLGRHFAALKRGQASSKACELMLLGLMAGSLEATVERTIQASLAASSIVLRSQVQPSAEGGEDAEAAAAADDALGNYFG